MDLSDRFAFRRPYRAISNLSSITVCWFLVSDKLVNWWESYDQENVFLLAKFAELIFSVRIDKYNVVFREASDPMSVKTDARGDRIMRALLRAGDITVFELVKQVGTSAPSIRRDLRRLEMRGLVLRTHGGATLVEPLLYEPFRHDTSFQARELRSADQKRRIGLAAAEMIQEKQTVGLTAGTTTTQIGRSLRHRRGINVVTNALNIGMELAISRRSRRR